MRLSAQASVRGHNVTTDGSYEFTNSTLSGIKPREWQRMVEQ